MKTKFQDFLVARPICSAISSNFCGLAATAQSPFFRQYCNCLARSLVAAFLAFGSAISVALLTRQEQKAKRRRKEGALRRKRVIICRPPAAAAAAGGAACQNSRSSDVLFRARTPRFSHMVIYCSSAPHSRRLTRDGRCPCLSCPSRRPPPPSIPSSSVRNACRPRPIAGHPPVRPSRFRRQTISRFRRLLLFLAVRSSVNHVRARAIFSLRVLVRERAAGVYESARGCASPCKP